ncbi:ATP-grasp domain-containing protein [Clostridium botulinum]
MKTLLIIGAGQFQVPIIKRARQLGYKTIVTDYDCNAKGFEYADIALTISTLDKEKTLEVIKDYKVDGVLTTSDLPVRTVAYVCEKLNLASIPYKAAIICTNKFLLRECMRENNIATPRYCLVDKNEQKFICDKLEQFKFPLIIKPVDSSASRGVIKLENKQSIKGAYNESVIYSKSGQVIIEEFIDGNEYSVEALTQNGETCIVAITEKTTSGYPYFVEERHIVPANLKEKEEEQIKEIVKKCINAIGLDNSASHSELKLTPNGPVIIEIGARLGGDYITSDLVPLATGINMIDYAIRLSLGVNINIDSRCNKFSGIQFIVPYNYESIYNNYEILKNDKNIIRCEMDKYDTNNDFKNSLDRLGYYISQGKSREELECTLNKYLYNKK